MVTIELTDEEARLLRGIIDNYRGDTRAEIVSTDAHDYRDKLHVDETTLVRIIDKLSVNTHAR